MISKMLLSKPDFAGFSKFVSFSALGGFTTWWLMNPREKKTVNTKNVIVTTGCDSGLGYSLAIYCHDKLNMSVIACIHQSDSRGATKLREMFSSSKRFHMVQLEVTKSESINRVEQFVRELLDKNKELELTALVNNCGTMCFGEAEWQTDEIIENQIAVNLAGSIRFTKSFLPLVRKHKSRIINVTSHCGIRALPGLSVYGATKAGLKGYNDALRLEMKKYGVDVVNFIPGSFVGSSNIAARQSQMTVEMRSALNEEQLAFYSDYFDRYNKYLEALSGEKEPEMITDENILCKFTDALLDVPPKAVYVSEPFRYKMYHLLFNISPHQSFTDYLINKFMSMPQFNSAAVKALKN